MEEYQVNEYTAEPAQSQAGPVKKKKSVGRVIGIVAAVLGSLLLAVGAGYSAKVLIDAVGEIRSGIEERRSAAGTAETVSASKEAGVSASEASKVNTAPVLQQTETKSGTVMLTDVSGIVEETLPSVVSINCTVVTASRYGRYESTSAGSGIIIGDNGTELWIVTNNHVIEGAVDMKVTFVDGSEAEMYLKGTSAENDLAVLGVQLSGLSRETVAAIRVIVMGDSDTLKLGQGVIAIGNALGWGQSVTTGVVSALDRTISFEDGSTMEHLLQTSAAINPGNSGGALLNAAGELIGINNAKYADTDVEGVGFAIPISSIREIMESLSLMEPRIPVAEEDTPYIGVTFREVSSSMSSAYGMPEGALIYSVGEGTPAEKAGLLSWDIITGLNDAVIRDYYDLTDELQYYSGGTEVTLKIARMDQGSWKEIEVKITLGYRKDYVK